MPMVYVTDEDLSMIATLRAENAKLTEENEALRAELLTAHCQYEEWSAERTALRADAERLDFIESQAKASRTGVSFDYTKFVEEGYVVEQGYRVMWLRNIGERHDTVRDAIDAAIAAGKGEV